MHRWPCAPCTSSPTVVVDCVGCYVHVVTRRCFLGLTLPRHTFEDKNRMLELLSPGCGLVKQGLKKEDNRHGGLRVGRACVGPARRARCGVCAIGWWLGLISGVVGWSRWWVHHPRWYIAYSYIYIHTHKRYLSPRMMITHSKMADQNVNHLWFWLAISDCQYILFWNDWSKTRMADILVNHFLVDDHHPRWWIALPYI
jgi:hypothetical protein